MRKLYEPANILHLLFLAGSLSILGGCHASGPEASPGIELPVVELSVMMPEVRADGSIRIQSEHLVNHIGTMGVFVLSDSNQARFRMVKAGKQTGDSISISSGLQGNEQILTGPFESVYDGSPIRLMKE